jgi:hypothetical protein
MTKILITGFRHSGTTLLLQLLRSHPQVGWIEFEEGYIEFDKPREWIIGMAQKRVSNFKKYAWGEKIPWGIRPDDKYAERAIKFSKRWLRFFGKKARIIQMLRHPIDAASSGRDDGNPGHDALEFMTTSLPKYIDFINLDKRCATLVYENLVLEPAVYLPKVFKFLGLDSKSEIVENIILNEELKFKRINPDRAYSYKGDGMDEEYDKYLERLENRL